MPLEVGEKIYYNNANYEGIICTDLNFIINSKNMEELTSDCDCKINSELNYLFINIASIIIIMSKLMMRKNQNLMLIFFPVYSKV